MPSFFIAFIIFLVFINRAGRRLAQSTRDNSRSSPASRTAPKTAPVQQTAEAPIQAAPEPVVKDAVNKKGLQTKRKYREDTRNVRLRQLEDRSNDWLARQMREEAKWKRNSCFDTAASVKKAHEMDCDAHDLKTKHATAHRKGRV